MTFDDVTASVRKDAVKTLVDCGCASSIHTHLRNLLENRPETVVDRLKLLDKLKEGAKDLPNSNGLVLPYVQDESAVVRTAALECVPFLNPPDNYADADDLLEDGRR